MDRTRRRFIHLAALSLVATRTAFANAAPPDQTASNTAEANAALESHIARVIAEYAAQGDHLTGTPVDYASARWLAGEIERLDVKTSLPSFVFDRVLVDKAELQWGPHHITGQPLFDGDFTTPAGVTGWAGDIDSAAEIGVLTATAFPTDARLEILRRARLANRHRAIVVVTDPSLPPDGLAAINADDYAKPFGPPVLQIPSRHWDALRAAMAAKTQLTVIAHGHRQQTTALNVQAEIPGRAPDLAPVVVMTPRSGWGACAAERGGGIAAFVEILRRFRENPPLRRIIFTANTGHELGHLGLDFFLRNNPALANSAHVWIHLGANFAASGDHQVWLQYSSEDWRRKFLGFVARAHVNFDKEVRAGEKPLGEVKNIAQAKGAYVSILGTNSMFHHPADRWPGAVDVPAVARWIAVLGAFTEAAANEPAGA